MVGLGPSLPPRVSVWLSTSRRAEPHSTNYPNQLAVPKTALLGNLFFVDLAHHGCRALAAGHLGVHRPRWWGRRRLGLSCFGPGRAAAAAQSHVSRVRRPVVAIRWLTGRGGGAHGCRRKAGGEWSISIGLRSGSSHGTIINRRVDCRQAAPSALEKSWPLQDTWTRHSVG